MRKKKKTPKRKAPSPSNHYTRNDLAAAVDAGRARLRFCPACKRHSIMQEIVRSIIRLAKLVAG